MKNKIQTQPNFLKDFDEPLWDKCTNRGKLLVVTQIFTIKKEHGPSEVRLQQNCQMCEKLDRLVDLTKIRFTISQTLQPRICRQSIVYWSLVPHNRFQAPNIRSSRQLYDNKLKLKWPNLVLRWPNLSLRRLNLDDYTRSCYWASMIYVVYLITHLVLEKIHLHLLILLQFRSNR